MSDGNIWSRVLEIIRPELDPEEFRRWFSASSYASDSGDQITVWVPAAADGRHISQNYDDCIQRALVSLGRTDTQVRFLATGYTDDEDDEEDNEKT
jgi:chromosomal replication initiation ATPase DnaA